MEDRIVAALRQIIRAVDLHSRRLVERHGLTLPQLTTLRKAAELGNASAGALAGAVHLSQPTLTGILDRLERRSLIRRTRNGQDRRSVLIEVTAEGLEVLGTDPSLLQDRFCRELAQLKEWEQTMILGTLQRIAAMMGAEGIDASPLLVSGAVDSEAGSVADSLPAADGAAAE